MDIFKLFTSPFDILGDSGTNNVESQIGSFALTDIAVILRTFIIGGATVTSIISLILMLYVKKNTRIIEEKKAAITSRLLYVWLASSAVPLFTLLKLILDELFGFTNAM